MQTVSKPRLAAWRPRIAGALGGCLVFASVWLPIATLDNGLSVTLFFDKKIVSTGHFIIALSALVVISSVLRWRWVTIVTLVLIMCTLVLAVNGLFRHFSGHLEIPGIAWLTVALGILLLAYGVIRDT